MSDYDEAVRRIQRAMAVLAEAPPGSPFAARVRSPRERAESVADLLPELLRDCPGAFRHGGASDHHGGAVRHYGPHPSEYHG